MCVNSSQFLLCYCVNDVGEGDFRRTDNKPILVNDVSIRHKTTKDIIFELLLPTYKDRIIVISLLDFWLVIDCPKLFGYSVVLDQMRIAHTHTHIQSQIITGITFSQIS